MNEVGGYFEIEFSNIKLGNIHSDAIKLNTARNCLEYILLANNFRKVFIPYYTCDAVLEPIVKHNLDYEFYCIDENLEPTNVPQCSPDEVFLYTNYFGIKNRFVEQIARKTVNLIIDNSQALFSPQINEVDTFYSLRKFVGVADGAFLYSKKKKDFHVEKAVSAERVAHLYVRKDADAVSGYKLYKENDDSLIDLPIMEMSNSTRAFIETYDFEKNKFIRERNFLFLHNELSQFNELKIDVSSVNGPLCYPFLKGNFEVKEELIKKKIYVPTYWSNVLGWIDDRNCVEKRLVGSLLPLPIDHRYTPRDFDLIKEILMK
jgi:hypothetical protein